MDTSLLPLCCLLSVVTGDFHVVQQPTPSNYTYPIELGEPKQQITDVSTAPECQQLCRDYSGCTAAMLIGHTCNLYTTCLTLKPDSCPDEAWALQWERTGKYVHHKVDTGMSFDEGFHYCSCTGGHMLAIGSQEEQDIIVGLLETDYNCVRIWTGGQAVPAGGFTFYWNMTDTLVPMTNYNNWFTNEPQGGADQYLAIAKGKAYKWADFQPSSIYNPECVICEFET